MENRRLCDKFGIFPLHLNYVLTSQSLGLIKKTYDLDLELQGQETFKILKFLLKTFQHSTV